MFHDIITIDTVRNVTVVQFRILDTNSFDYISGNTALKEKKIEIKEINAAGRVNEITLINHSEDYVFFSDGDILVGAKQNRTLNTSLLIAPKRQEIIPVSCVEQGRWSTRSSHFTFSDYDLPFEMRLMKNEDVHSSLIENMGFYADQHKLWDEIANYARVNKSSSSTGDLNELRRKTDQGQGYPNTTISVSPEASGVSFFVNEKLISVEAFNRSSIYTEYYPKLLRSALEIGAKTKRKPVRESEVIYRLQNFMDAIDVTDAEEYKAPAEGTEKRFKSDSFLGFQLFYNNLLIHMVFFAS